MLLSTDSCLALRINETAVKLDLFPIVYWSQTSRSI